MIPQNSCKFDVAVIGYYPIRGTAQVCRMLCQYLHIPYKDLFFTPQTWQVFKQKQAKNWDYHQLPFLADNELIITETLPICLHLILKSNRKDLLGITPHDKVKVDMFLWQVEIMKIMLSVFKNLKDEPMQNKKTQFCKFWNEHLRQKLINIESEATSSFYLPYLTIVDFFIYDFIYVFNQWMPFLVHEFPKLKQIYLKVAKIKEISDYQSSSRAIKNICPAEFCQKWKQKCRVQCQRQQ